MKLQISHLTRYEYAWLDGSVPAWRRLTGLDPTHVIICRNAHVPVTHAVVAESVKPILGAHFSPVPAIARMTSDVRSSG